MTDPALTEPGKARGTPGTRIVSAYFECWVVGLAVSVRIRVR